jgi:hypothetical protein
MTKLVPAKQKELTVPITQPLKLTVEDILAETDEIRGLMRRSFRENHHYGTIGNSAQPVLLKKGAIAICRLLLLRAGFRLIRRDRENGHFAYEATCRLIYRPTREIVGEGNGVCSSMETKYRYRRSEAESTGRLVPQAFWNLRKTNPSKAQELLGGPEFVQQRIDGVYMICRKGSERVENEDIEELDHTIELMAQKRSYINAVLFSTAAAELFIPQNPEDDDDDELPIETKARQESPQATPTSTTEKREPKSYKAALWDALTEAYDKARVPAELKRLTGKSSISELTENEARDALLFFEGGAGDDALQTSGKTDFKLS